MRTLIVTQRVSAQKMRACNSTISARNQLRGEFRAWSGGKVFTVVADIDCSPSSLPFKRRSHAEGLGVARVPAGSADGGANDPQRESAPRRHGRAVGSFRRETPGA